MSRTSLGHRPSGVWEFDASVAQCFPDMLARSIPDCQGMRDLTFRVGSRFVVPRTDIVDLGSSRGGAVERFLDRFGAQNRYELVETAPAMVEVLRERFRGYIDCSVVSLHEVDLRERVPAFRASLVLSVLTLQFVPINHRARILREAYKNLEPGGALVLVEKVLGASAETDRLLVDLYHQTKHDNGYSWDEIEAKRKALEGVLVPVTAEWNEATLRTAGFSFVECYWRSLSFAGWVAIK